MTAAYDDFCELQKKEPSVANKLILNMALNLSTRLRMNTEEIKVLAENWNSMCEISQMPRTRRMIIDDQGTVYHVMSRTALDGFPLGDVE